MTETTNSLSDLTPRGGVLAGGGEMGARMRAVDWSRTALGPVETWPQALKTSVRIMLTSRQPMFVWWGDELVNLYNDAYRDILGGKHPQALGRPAAIVWQEIWDQVGPRARSAMLGNEGTYDEALLLIMERHGYPEETYYTFSYSPVPNDEGGTGGILCANTNDTARIIGERQLALLRALAAETAEARTIADACRLSGHALQSNLHDLPFALIYLIDREEQRAVLAGRSNIAPDHPAAPAVIPLAPGEIWPIAEVVNGNAPYLISELPASLGPYPTGAWKREPARAVALPIAPSGETGQGGVLVCALNAYRLYDGDYRRFLELVAGQIAAAIANAQAYEEERRRAESLAELDRAKTVFFSNVSHEFRTPLTLLIGPLEDALAGAAGPLTEQQRQWLEAAHRNALRLLRLVNSLLDFSRIEASRVRASYQATDLSAITADLASTFRSATERAGLRLIIDCPPLPSGLQVFVDREMWEKIVLNLLSNAFKFTLEGEIEVRLRAAADERTVELAVRDTGAGIPADELPRLFERFHRVQGARARTLEGTGIGLALVQELVKLHGGTVRVDSVLGQGTTFTVTLPIGKAHLPPDQVDVPDTLASTALGAAPYVEEALRWLPDASDHEPALARDDLAGVPTGETVGTERGRVLLADDNADMREYVARLLGRHYDIETVPDGAAALAAAQERPPDLILSDVMMPRMDGFALLQAVRADPRIREVPVVLLSARAGEEAQVEGLDAGADDYLVKPFAARELLARVGAHLALGRMRREVSRREQTARAEAEAAVRVRDEFLSIASHELRTPVTVIKATSQLLQRALERNRLDSERLPRSLETIDRASNRLTLLVNDLLDVSRLQTGRLNLRREPLDLVTLLRDVVERHCVQPEEGHEWRITVPDDPLPVLGDAARVEQILDNLLDNAVKYSPEGGTIDVTLESDPAGATITVQDRGIGLPEGAAELIFEPFGRAANAIASSLPGMGLGLYISRRIADLHGGTLRAESSGEGQGTTFRLWLPATG